MPEEVKPSHTLKPGQYVNHPNAGRVKVEAVNGDKVNVSFTNEQGAFVTMDVSGEHMQYPNGKP